MNKILIEKYKDISEISDFERKFWSRTAIGIYEIGHDIIRIMNWLAYYDRSSYEKIN